MNIGVLYAITTGTEIHLNKQPSHEWKLLAIMLSTTSTSLLNRFKTLPTGVVSKKIIGEAMIFLIKVACKMRPALTLPKYRPKLPATVNKPENEQI